jgi:hypothetical protein
MVNVTHDGDRTGPGTPCCACGQATHHWYARRDIPLCTACAAVTRAQDLPTHRAWEAGRHTAGQGVWHAPAEKPPATWIACPFSGARVEGPADAEGAYRCPGCGRPFPGVALFGRLTRVVYPRHAAAAPPSGVSRPLNP